MRRVIPAVCAVVALTSSCGLAREPGRGGGARSGADHPSASADGPAGAGTPLTAATASANAPAPSRGRVTPGWGAVPSPAPRLVRSAVWVSRAGVRALKVVPTPVMRTHPSTQWADAAWVQVRRLVPAARGGGLRDQFVCHAQFASRKPAWYLEPDRPDVGYARTVLAGCNPGSVRDVG